MEYLEKGTRYKISADGSIRGLPQQWRGRWVALVLADNDCHLKADEQSTKSANQDLRLWHKTLCVLEASRHCYPYAADMRAQLEQEIKERLGL